MNRYASLRSFLSNCFKFFMVSTTVFAILPLVNTALAQTITTGNVTNFTPFTTNIQGVNVKLSSDGTKATAVWLGTQGGLNVIDTASATIVGNVATWGSTSTIFVTGGGRNALSVDLALSDDGTKAIAVWSLFNGTTGNDVEAATATITGTTATWSTPAVISLTISAVAPKVALSGNGDLATAAWLETNSGHRLVRSASATINSNVATWGSVNDLSDSNQDSANVQLALSSDGQTAIANWYRSDGTNAIIQAAPADISGTTATWGTVTDLSAAGEDGEANEIALSADGSRATSIWRRSNGTNVIVQSKSATIASNTANWGAVTNVSASGQDAGSSGLGISADGTEAVIAWSRSDGTNPIIQAKAATISGNTLTLGSTTNLSVSGKDALFPKVLLSDDGSKAVVAYSRFNDSSIFVAHAVAGVLSGTSAVWSAPFDLTDGSATTAVFPSGLSSNGLVATFGLFASSGSTTRALTVSALINYDPPTPTPTVTPVPTNTFTPTPTSTTASTSTPFSTPEATATATPIATPTSIGVPFSAAPKVKAKVKNNTITVTVTEKAKTKAVSHHAYVLREENYSLYKKVRILTRDGKGSVTIKKVPAGTYRVFVVTKRSVKPKTVSTKATLITIS